MMVRFSITETELRRRIEKEVPGWLSRAETETRKIVINGPPKHFPSLWSEIKQVYMALQGSKCAFCEKWLEDETFEHDVEHFRPKGRVDRWLVPSKLRNAGVPVQHGGGGSAPGYARLGYHPLNYVTACQRCNRRLKRNWFPVAGSRDSNACDPASLSSEQAYLIYPISDIDDDPEDLITFHGISPRARFSGGFRCHRALITIEVFQLDNWRLRKEVNRDRAEFLEKLSWALTLRDNPASTADQVQKAKTVIDRFTKTNFRHANCLRSFERVYEKNPAEAQAIYSKVHDWLKTVSP